MATEQAQTSLRRSSHAPPCLCSFKPDVTKHYELGKLIGAGTFGSVYEATCRATGKAFAIKAVQKRFAGDFLEPFFVRRVQHEVDIYFHMGNSLNVAHLWDVYEDGACVDLVMDRCYGGELWKRIRQGHYQERDAARLVREVLRTVSQFHANGVVIRDVKPENFLFATDCADSHLKAIDFGIAQYCKSVPLRCLLRLPRPDETLRDRAGTPIYVAPEVLKMEYSQKADLWSAGIIAYQLLTGRLPFVGETGLMVSKLYMAKQVFSNKDVFRAILYAELDYEREPWPHISAAGKALVQALLTRDPGKRLTAAEALQHPWFDQLEAGSHSSNDARGNGAQLSDSNGAMPTQHHAAGNGAAAPDGAAARPSAPGGARQPAPQHARSAHHGSGALLDTVVQRLQRFGTYGRLKQVALQKIASAWLPIAGNAELLDEIQSTFQGMDSDGDGRVPYSAVVDLLKQGNFDLSDTEIEVLISQMDITHEGCVKYEEWLAAMMEWRTLQESEEWDHWVQQAFQAFDEDGSGTITADALAAMLCNDGVCHMPDIVSAALREADKDGDQAISLDEFVRLVELNKMDSLSNFGDYRRR